MEVPARVDFSMLAYAHGNNTDTGARSIPSTPSKLSAASAIAAPALGAVSCARPTLRRRTGSARPSFSWFRNT